MQFQVHRRHDRTDTGKIFAEKAVFEVFLQIQPFYLFNDRYRIVNLFLQKVIHAEEIRTDARNMHRINNRRIPGYVIIDNPDNTADHRSQCLRHMASRSIFSGKRLRRLFPIIRLQCNALVLLYDLNRLPDISNGSPGRAVTDYLQRFVHAVCDISCKCDFLVLNNHNQSRTFVYFGNQMRTRRTLFFYNLKKAVAGIINSRHIQTKRCRQIIIAF